MSKKSNKFNSASSGLSADDEAFKHYNQEYLRVRSRFDKIEELCQKYCVILSLIDLNDDGNAQRDVEEVEDVAKIAPPKSGKSSEANEPYSYRYAMSYMKDVYSKFRYMYYEFELIMYGLLRRQDQIDAHYRYISDEHCGSYTNIRRDGATDTTPLTISCQDYFIRKLVSRL